MREVVIVDSVRTGLAKSHRGSFNQTRPDDLLAHCIDSLLARNDLDPALVEDVVAGVARQTGEQANNIARMAVMLSRLPVSVAAATIGRACSSGLNAIAVAANQIASGFTDVAIAGGVESITALGRHEDQYPRHKRLESEYPDIYLTMGETAEIVAERYAVTRQQQDEYALASQQRYAAAAAERLFDDEIVPMSVQWRKVVDRETGASELVDAVVSSDECNRPHTTLEDLAKLNPAFLQHGTVTAGNASQLSDGASLTLLMSEARARQLALEPLAYYRGFTVAGCEPDEMGIGPVFAVPRLLQRAGLSLQDIDLIELNEAFASQCVYCRDRLEIDPEIYNVNGGSIAIGHPFGMTGSRLTGHLARELNRRGKRYGVVSMCIGHGMGAAGLIEAAH